MNDSAFMRRALELAERGWGQTAPNPMVGAVVVRHGRIVGEGWHQRYGAAHAEVNALAAAGSLAAGSHLFVTLEPCSHRGKTPPCVDAVLRAGASAVSIATLDPTVAGGGARLLQERGVSVDVGCLEEKARELNAGFHFAARAQRPWVTLKLALSTEGAIAPAEGDDGRRTRAWLTGEAARDAVHRMRAGSDAVAVGVGTVIADDPQLTVRHSPAPRVQPRRIVFDRRLRIPLDSALVRTAVEVTTLVVAGEDRPAEVAALRERGVDVIRSADLRDALRQLHGRGVRSLLVEGGAGLAGELLNGDFVDRLILIQSALSLGAGALDAFAGVRDRARLERSLELRVRRPLGSDTMSIYAVEGHVV